MLAPPVPHAKRMGATGDRTYAGQTSWYIKAPACSRCHMASSQPGRAAGPGSPKPSSSTSTEACFSAQLSKVQGARCMRTHMLRSYICTINRPPMGGLPTAGTWPHELHEEGKRSGGKKLAADLMRRTMRLRAYIHLVTYIQTGLTCCGGGRRTAHRPFFFGLFCTWQ